MNTTGKIIHKSNYIVIKQVLSKEVCQLLSQYAVLKSSISPNVKKDMMVNIHREYGDPMMETLLEQLTPLIEKATDTELWPTLSFYYTYKKGNRLNKHKDKSCCQIVAGLCIGADEAFVNRHGTWPLVLNINGEAEPISLDFGDILVFRGHETEHWRDVFTGEWFVSAIFGYVDRKGPFAFQKYDQRSALGKPHIGMFRWSFGCLKQQLKNWLS